MLREISGLLVTLMLRLLPHHRLSRMMYRLARVQTPAVKNTLIRLFIRRYRVDMDCALHSSPDAYPDFNSFFTRALKPGARPVVTGADEIAVPVDGTVSQCGAITRGRLYQAKGLDYDLDRLLGGADGTAALFADGCFATLYLSPRDYHRIHMPVDGTLREMRYLPGRLFSVNHYSTRHVRRLFARNERLVTLFDTPAGPMALILVGAIFVSGIETVWAGEVRDTLGVTSGPRRWDYSGQPSPIRLARGAELGRFNMGSTVIVLFGPGRVRLAPALQPDAPVRMGQLMGWINRGERLRAED